MTGSNLSADDAVAKLPNKELRLAIANLVHSAKEGHIPSAFSIVDIINHLYERVLRVDSNNPRWAGRDYFVLSKGHGCAALYVVLHKFGFLTDHDMEMYGRPGGILGGHPDFTCVPGVEASTGSLGHGFPTATGLALGLRIRGMPNRVYALLGDGECNEGTVWESALVAARQALGQLVAIVDLNGSAAQILPVDPLADKWRAFGWKCVEVDGHSDADLSSTFERLTYAPTGKPTVVIAHTTKGKGVTFTEGHGPWHHKIPTSEELDAIRLELE